MKTLETRRLILRKFRPDDLAAVYGFMSRPENTIYTAFWPDSEEETRAFISRSIRKAEKCPCEEYHFAAVTKAEGILIGSCNFLLSGEGGSNIGWIVNCDYWQQGYGTEMGEAMLKLAFDDLNFHRIIACCDAENVGSWRVMERIGMRREGLFLNCRRAHKRSERRAGDEVRYAISRDEWEALNRAEMR